MRISLQDMCKIFLDARTAFLGLTNSQSPCPYHVPTMSLPCSQPCPYHVPNHVPQVIEIEGSNSQKTQSSASCI